MDHSVAPAANRVGEKVTWLKSQWKLCVYPAQFRVEINSQAVEWDKPFLSETGYRSFFGLGGGLVPNLTQEAFAAEAISGYVKASLKDGLVAIQPQYRRPSI